MINLRFIFEDSIKSLGNGSEILQNKSLPIVILMMQKDVINHYKLAIRHYFDLSLKESYLQNSSWGTPYDKWRKFANDDFDLLFFSIKTLVQYSSRLFHESELRQRIEDNDFETLKMDSRRYGSLIHGFKYQDKSLGIVIDEGEILEINELVLEGVKLEDRWCSVKTTKVTISDRSVLSEISAKAEAEITSLEKIHGEYIKQCKAFCMTYDIFSYYENKHHGY